MGGLNKSLISGQTFDNQWVCSFFISESKANSNEKTITFYEYNLDYQQKKFLFGAFFAFQSSFEVARDMQ